MEPEIEASQVDLQHLSLPSEFSGAKRKEGDEDESNLSQILDGLRDDESIEYVNLLVISNSHSHRPSSSHIRRDIFEMAPKPRMVIHNIWPSTRVTRKNSNRIRIKPIMPRKTRGFNDIPKRYKVPSSGWNSIQPDTWKVMETDWFPLTEDVSIEDFQDYNFYKHSRFNFLEQVQKNVWDVTIDRAMPIVSEDLNMNPLMTLIEYLSQKYEFGNEYACQDLETDINSYFGVEVYVKFAIGYKGRYWKELCILFDRLMDVPEDYNANKPRYLDTDTFLFESIYTRTDLFVDSVEGKLWTYDIVFVGLEASPYYKSGALGDFCRSLPIALAKQGHRVMVVSPRYRHNSPSSATYTQQAKVYCSNDQHEVAFYREYKEGVDWVFVDHPTYQDNSNFVNSQFQSTLLCHAACEAPLLLSFRGIKFCENCLFIATDCHAGLVPMLLEANYRPKGVYQNARTILVIHNIAVQGVELASTYSNLGLPANYYETVRWILEGSFPPDAAVNILKGAILTSDLILTVSQGYSWEILTSEGGYGLHDVLSSRYDVFSGITSGIDINEWNPSADECIYAYYASHDLSGKVKCKEALQKELNLPLRADCPLIGFIGSLDMQKGADIILLAIPELVASDIQFVMLAWPLGSGEKFYEDLMVNTELSFPDFFRGRDGFSTANFHRIIAGCDILLMPSRSEPYGSNSLYAMRYGTVPVVHATGGLKDTVQNFHVDSEGREKGTGWAFSPLTSACMLESLEAAVSTYRDYKFYWHGLMRRGMELMVSWDDTAEQYEHLINCFLR